MDKQAELINALLLLSRQCEAVARLLSQVQIGQLCDDALVSISPDADVSIDVRTFADWPVAKADPTLYGKYFMAGSLIARLLGGDWSDGTPLKGHKVLEFNCGDSRPVAVAFTDASIHLISDDFKFQDGQPEHVKMLASFADADTNYDIGIVYEALEFCDDPVMILTQLAQRCKKIYLSLRPWTSRDGAFQSAHFNRAFAHLLMPIENGVRFKVVRPLASYESMLAKAGLAVIERKVRSHPVEDYFTTNDELLKVIIARTWGTIRRQEAIKIMAIEAVEYIAMP